MYTTMAMFVAEVLHIRPGEILDTWNVPELIVTYGNYANEKAQRNFAEWEGLEPQQKFKVERPPEYAVKFIGVL